MMFNLKLSEASPGREKESHSCVDGLVNERSANKTATQILQQRRMQIDGTSASQSNVVFPKRVQIRTLGDAAAHVSSSNQHRIVLHVEKQCQISVMHSRVLSTFTASEKT